MGTYIYYINHDITLLTFHKSRLPPSFGTSKCENSSQLKMLLLSIFGTKLISLKVIETETCKAPAFHFLN